MIAAGELELDLDVKDADLQDLLGKAERNLNPAKVYYGGQKLEATESSSCLMAWSSSVKPTLSLVSQRLASHHSPLA